MTMDKKPTRVRKAPAKKAATPDLSIPRELAEEILELLDSKKAVEPIILEVGSKTVVADFFVVASAKSTTAVRALGEHVIEKLKKDRDIMVLRREGLSEGRWAALDYGSVIVHIFLQEARDTYQLEKLWA